MHKLVVLLRGGMAGSEALQRRWSEEFVPVAEKMPGLRRVQVGRSVGAPAAAPDVVLIHEFLFDDMDALHRAMTSPEGEAAGRALMAFAAARAELFFAEHHDMELTAPGRSQPGDTAEKAG
jgi:uncharacterized protein (TIGR02118 family)